ncbi:MAG: Gfo/Idh/MocA family oxidoreductase [Candidatus Lokiarchaeota archaeon]|nr:Gfo/Idh/MocA family oxidoreductase [Candidatus Lokiarchaeota archaeon]
MEKKDKEFRSSHFARLPVKYLPPEDKYIFAPPNPKYKFNLIGTGMMGLEHLRVTYLEGRATIHGIYDPNPQSVAAAQGVLSQIDSNLKLKVYDDLESACMDPEVDGLIISTPNFSHISVIREAVKSKKHILLEKPMATTIPDAHEIYSIAKNYPAVFQIGLQYRYKAMYVDAIQEALNHRKLGDIKMIHILEHRIPFLDKVKQWNKFNQYSGGTLVEKCCHYFDLMNLFAQSRPKKVYATGSMAVNFRSFEYNGRKSDILDNAVVSVDYENGVRAGFTLCMFSPQFYEELMLCGDEGHLRTYESVDFLPGPKQKTSLEIKVGENSTSRISQPCYPTYIEQSGHSGATFFEHKYFIDTIEGSKSSVATAEEGFWSIVVGYAAQKSIELGGPIKINELLQEYSINL